MFLSRFRLPLGEQYRLYLDAQTQDSAPVAVDTTTLPPASVAELSARLKHLCPLHLVRRLNECPEMGGCRLELDFSDYLGVCGPQQRCLCDQRAGIVNDVPMGGDSAAGEQLFIGTCDVVAESKRAPVELSTSFKPRFCDVTASSSESLLVTTLGHDVVYVIHSDAAATDGDTTNSDDGVGIRLKRCSNLDGFEQPFLGDNGLDVEKFIRTISELLPWLEGWVDEQMAAGRHGDTEVFASVDSSKDELTAFAETSVADTVDANELSANAADVKSSQFSAVVDSWDSESQDEDEEDDMSDMSSGVIKTKAVSCPLVLKSWSTDKSDEQTSGSPRIAGAVRLSEDVNELDPSSPQVFETWDSAESDPDDAVASPMGEDSVDIVDDVNIVDTRTPGDGDVVESWDSEEEEDRMNRNALVETEQMAKADEMSQLQFVANMCPYEYPGVRVEWCPYPFQLIEKRAGDVTEPEVWESDSGGDVRIPDSPSADEPDERVEPPPTTNTAETIAEAIARRLADDDATWNAIFDDESNSSQVGVLPNAEEARNDDGGGNDVGAPIEIELESPSSEREDDGCSTPAEAQPQLEVAATKTDDPDAIELLDQLQPDKSGASGDAVADGERHPQGSAEEEGRRNLWQRIRRQLRGFARRFSRIFRRRRYRPSAIVDSTDQASDPAPADVAD